MHDTYATDDARGEDVRSGGDGRLGETQAESTEATGAWPSRRGVIRGMLASAGAAVGWAPGGAAAGVDPDAGGGSKTYHGGDAPSTTTRAVMFPYQLTPGARITVVESDLGWTPRRVGSDYRSHVVRYDRAPSLRVFLFTEESLDAGASYALGSRISAASGAGPRLVGVTVE